MRGGNKIPSKNDRFASRRKVPLLSFLFFFRSAEKGGEGRCVVSTIPSPLIKEYPPFVGPRSLYKEKYEEEKEKKKRVMISMEEEEERKILNKGTRRRGRERRM